MTHAWKLVTSHPKLVLLVAGALLAASLLLVQRGLPLDGSADTLILHNSEAYRDYRESRKVFGDDRVLIVGFTTRDAFDESFLRRLREFTARVGQTPGISQVISLTNVLAPHSTSTGVRIAPLIPDDLASADLAALKQSATQNEVYAGNLVSRDGRTAAVNILLGQNLPNEERRGLTSEIVALAKASRGGDDVFFAGEPFVEMKGALAIQRDLLFFTPITLLLLAALLWAAFRSLRGVLLPLIAVIAGVTWLFGLMSALGSSLNMVSLMLPTLVLAIGCSYVIHLYNQYVIAAQGRNLRSVEERRVVVLETLAFIGTPVLLSGLTIIAGFLSLSFTGIPAIRNAGLFAAAGALFTLILSLTLVPALLVLLPSSDQTRALDRSSALGARLQKLGESVTRYQRAIYALTGFLILLSAAAATQLQVSIDYFHFFRNDAEISEGMAKMHDRLTGAISFEIVVDGGAPGAIERPEMLRLIEQTQQFISGVRVTDISGQQHGVDRTLSVADFVKMLNQAFHGSDPRQFRIPGDPAMVRELLADRESIGSFVSEDGSTAAILVRSTLSDSRDMSSALQQIERFCRGVFPSGFRIYPTGTFVLLNQTSDLIAHEQTRSLALALGMIFLILALLFRSFRVGLTALVPNLIPILFFFGAMGIGRFPLNLNNTLVASVVLGLAVDNAVQFIVRFRSCQKAGMQSRDAIIESMHLSGRPIVSANLALIVSFAIFAFSDFVPVASFGILSAVTIMGCLIEDLVLLPARLTSPLFQTLARAERRALDQNGRQDPVTPRL